MKVLRIKKKLKVYPEVCEQKNPEEYYDYS